MAAKGAIAKEEVLQKILEAFPGSFKYDKEIKKLLHICSRS